MKKVIDSTFAKRQARGHSLKITLKKEKGKGTGLGLSISKAIVKEHFGEFLINYELSNTQFVIRLPKREFFCLYPKD